MSETPTILVERRGAQLTFRCPKCGKRHLHGLGEGHRVSHCRAPGAFPTGYILKLADDATPTEGGAA